MHIKKRRNADIVIALLNGESVASIADRECLTTMRIYAIVKSTLKAACPFDYIEIVKGAKALLPNRRILIQMARAEKDALIPMVNEYGGKDGSKNA